MLIFSISDTGMVRSNNEDYHRYDRDKRIILVADGMGGHAHGEIASRVAVESAWHYLLRNESLSEDESLEPDQAITECIAFANQKVLNQQRIKPSYYDMGTTLVVAWQQGQTLYFGWVGDSRLYLLRGNDSFERLTVDHTVYQERRDKGEDPNIDMTGHIITRMIGSMYNAVPGLGAVEVTRGDLLLACTDGITDMVPDAGICECLQDHRDRLFDAPMALRNRAYEKGARDNLTAVVGRVV